MLEHQFAKLKQFKESGKPALRKQEATWTAQALCAVEQPFASENSGMGVEHQFPHLYSQVGVGVTVVVFVQSDGLVEVVVTTVEVVFVEDEVVVTTVEVVFVEDDVVDVVDFVDELDPGGLPPVQG